MAQQERVVPAGPLWTDEELRVELASAGTVEQHRIPVPASLWELDPARARARARRARKVLAALAITTALLVVTAIVIPSFRRGLFSGVSVQVLVFAVFNGWFTWRHRERLRTDVPEGSQAEGFVRALLDATAVTRAIRGRWLVFNSTEDASLVTQEEHWTAKGPQPVLHRPWSAADGPITEVRQAGRRWAPSVRVTFADGSWTVLALDRQAREDLLRHWPAA